ncbi:unnamed protein product [Prunus brigantina]
MKSEMDSMYTNKVRTLVDPPLGIVPIGNKWIFKRKIGSDGKVETYKARLQASRSWNIRFDEVVKSFDFIQNMDDQCVYKKVSGSSVVFLILYVDDILIIGNDIGMLSSVKLWLTKSFSMKDLGEASYILGIKIYHHWGAVKCILKYLRRTKDMFLVYGGTSSYKWKRLLDSDFASDVDDRKSTSGYVFILNGGVVSWRSCK